MHGQRRTRMPLKIVAATIGGISLVSWAVAEVLPWVQTTALVFGVVLVAYGAAANARPDGAAERTNDAATTN